MYYVGIDLGTSAVKLVLMDERDGQSRIRRTGGPRLSQVWRICWRAWTKALSGQSASEARCTDLSPWMKMTG